MIDKTNIEKNRNEAGNNVRINNKLNNNERRGVSKYYVY